MSEGGRVRDKVKDSAVSLYYFAWIAGIPGGWEFILGRGLFWLLIVKL